MVMMRGKRKATCDKGRGKEVGDTEEDEVVECAETNDEAGTRCLIELGWRGDGRGFDVGDEAERTRYHV